MASIGKEKMASIGKEKMASIGKEKVARLYMNVYRVWEYSFVLLDHEQFASIFKKRLFLNNVKTHYTDSFETLIHQHHNALGYISW